MSSKDKNELFEVDGFKVYDNTTYRLRQKKDDNAPQEMQQMGLSKYPGAPTYVKCRFLTNGNVYDTGFEPSSRLYLHYTKPTEVKNIIKQRRENVLKPFLTMNGLDEDRFRPSSLEDWDNFLVELDTEVTFNTNDYKKRMELYIGLIRKAIVPPNADEFDYKYDNANFVLEYSENKRKVSTENKLLKLKASGRFTTLLEENQEGLLDILVYLGAEELCQYKGSVDALIAYLDKVVLKTIATTELFVSKYTELGTEDGANELRAYRLITKGLKRKDKRFAEESGKVYFNQTVIGNTRKDAANQLATNKNHAELLDELLLSE